MAFLSRLTGSSSPQEPAAFEDVDAPDVAHDGDSAAGASQIPSVNALVQFANAPMTATMARNVRFNTSTPEGYFFPQVEKYVEQVGDTMAWYESLKYAYERALHDVQVELDHQTYDAQRLRTEIELFKVTGSPMVNADGSYLTESQVAAADDVASDLAEKEAQLVGALARVTELEVEIGRAHAYIATQDAQVEQFRAQTAAANAAADDAMTRAAAAEQRAAAASARADQCDVVILALQQDNERLQVAVQAAADAVVASPDPAVLPAHAVAPDASGPAEQEYAQAGLPEAHDSLPGSEHSDGDHGREYSQDYGHEYEQDAADGYLGLGDGEAPVVPVVPVESELPPGTVLPSHSPAGQSQAGPGAPLGNPGVPHHVWAPELSDPALSPAPAVQGFDDPGAVPQPSLRPRG